MGLPPPPAPKKIVEAFPGSVTRANNDLTCLIMIFSFLVAGSFLIFIQNFSLLGNVLLFILLFFIATFGIFYHEHKLTSSTDAIPNYILNNTPQKLKGPLQESKKAGIQTIKTKAIWQYYIHSLLHHNRDENRSHKTFLGNLFVYFEWLIGFFRITVLGRYLAFIFAIAIIIIPLYIQFQEQRLATVSNTVAQAEAFLQAKYPDLENIKDDKDIKDDKFYYGSAIGLKEALEFLHRKERDFASVYLPKTALTEINLSGADLALAKFKGAWLVGADLSGAILFKADLSGAVLVKAVLIGADLSGAILSGAYIAGANFTDAIYLTKEQIMSACWRRKDNFGRNLDPPTLPNYEEFEEFDVSEIPPCEKKD